MYHFLSLLTAYIMLQRHFFISRKIFPSLKYLSAIFYGDVRFRPMFVLERSLCYKILLQFSYTIYEMILLNTSRESNLTFVGNLFLNNWNPFPGTQPTDFRFLLITKFNNFIIWLFKGWSPPQQHYFPFFLFRRCDILWRTCTLTCTWNIWL